MTGLIEEIKLMKNATKEEIDQVIYDYSYKVVVKDLKEIGVNPDELEEKELNQLVAEENKKNRSLCKGTLAGVGAIAFLELAG